VDASKPKANPTKKIVINIKYKANSEKTVMTLIYSGLPNENLLTG
jgi:hypothetical protein